MKLSRAVIFALVPAIFIFSKCSENKTNEEENKKDSTVAKNTAYGGYENQVKYGEHIVAISGCNDCHTPKKMGLAGPEIDFSLALSGHPEKLPIPDMDRKQVESKGLAVTNDLTVWLGPWGVSYAANLTPDSTGIGNWKEDQFLLCIREGKSKGIAGSRMLLPPMPWRELKAMTDDELKAIFAYLKSIKPIHNIVPAAQMPMLAEKK